MDERNEVIKNDRRQMLAGKSLETGHGALKQAADDYNIGVKAVEKSLANNFGGVATPVVLRIDVSHGRNAMPDPNIVSRQKTFKFRSNAFHGCGEGSIEGEYDFMHSPITYHRQSQ